MTQTGHTPGPWKIVEGHIEGADGSTVQTDVYYPYYSTGDMQYLVRAVNCHDDLLAALKYLEQRIDALNGQRGDITRLCLLCGAADYDATVGVKHLPHCAILVARAALAKAEAKP